MCSPEDLYVKLITVDEAPTAKRIRFQSMGRVFRYRKRYSHLTVVLEERAAKPAAAQPPGTKAKEEPTMRAMQPERDKPPRRAHKRRDQGAGQEEPRPRRPPRNRPGEEDQKMTLAS